MARLATPGVYLVEKNAFTSSVVAVPTAVPAFIGYTEKAIKGKTNLTNKPTRVTSFPEFMELFGGASYAYSEKHPFTQYELLEDPDSLFQIGEASNLFYLFSSIRMFYNNGGGNAYIVSVGSYEDQVTPGAFEKGIDLLLKEQEPTMVLAPDLMLLDKADCDKVQQAMLMHCGAKTRSRIALFDVHEGHMDVRDKDVITGFREGIGQNNLDFGAAYYPWLNTSIVDAVELDYRNIANLDVLEKILLAEAAANFPDEEGPVGDGKDWSTLGNQAKAEADKLSGDKSNLEDVKRAIAAVDPAFRSVDGDTKSALKKAIDNIVKEATSASGEPVNDKYQTAKETIQALSGGGVDTNTLNATLNTISPTYKAVMKEVRLKINVLPPSGAMAGIYSMNDAMVGVHRSPANVSVASVVSPTVIIGNGEQEDLNMPLNGKAVNAIRSFIGKGVLVWGARTLDGNSQDWRYIGVRRTMIMIEQSIKNAIEAFVFEPNTARTWIKVKTSIDNFLTTTWQAGSLAGATPPEAFETIVGLGTTMTPEDILEGVMRVSVKVAITRPAEFIVITFQQKMQES